VVKTGIPMLKKQMSKFTLDIEYDFNFILIGISCHEKDYRISWALRERLAIDLCRGEDIVIASKKPGESGAYAVFEAINEENDSSIFLVSNRTDSSFLVPEQRSVDYLIARGGYDAENQEEIVQQIRGIPFVLTAFAIDAESLKSRQNLIF
jgi:hypothetical protein